jgi:hypothetical protein
MQIDKLPELVLTFFKFVHSLECYGLDGPGIESRWGRDFQHPFRPTLGPTQPPIQWVSTFFFGGKAAEV